MSIDDVKKQIGIFAAELVKDQMIIGLGTGSTAYFFIEHLSERVQKGLKIQAVASSKRSYDQASANGIKMLDIESLTSIDMTIDGADEVDPQKRMIKGGGGALLREKIVATMSKEMIVIIDESKLSDRLGRHLLPVEVIPFAHHFTHYQLTQLGYKGAFRLDKEGNLYLTDNGNFIIDIKIDPNACDPEKDHQRMIAIPGVVETGFFFNLAKQVIIGYNDGRVEVKP